MYLIHHDWPVGSVRVPDASMSTAFLHVVTTTFSNLESILHVNTHMTTNRHVKHQGFIGGRLSNSAVDDLKTRPLDGTGYVSFALLVDVLGSWIILIICFVLLEDLI